MVDKTVDSPNKSVDPRSCISKKQTNIRSSNGTLGGLATVPSGTEGDWAIVDAITKIKIIIFRFISELKKLISEILEKCLSLEIYKNENQFWQNYHDDSY